jgi:hypothetical protein
MYAKEIVCRAEKKRERGITQGEGKAKVTKRESVRKEEYKHQTPRHVVKKRKGMMVYLFPALPHNLTLQSKHPG